MPIIKSAKKRVRVAQKAAVRNTKTKKNLKASSKAFTKKPSASSQSKLQSNIDKAAKKGVIHKNKAARLKKRASAALKKSGSPTKKTTAKKSTAKKK